MTAEDPAHAAALLERISRLLGSDAHAEGLKPVQWEALRYLARANRFSNTAAALTAYLGLTKGTVSQTLMTLDGKGLVRKRADSHDRRTTRLALTPAARRLLKKDPLLGIETALAALPATTRRQLGEGLSALLTAGLSLRGRRPFGECHACRHFARNHPQGAPHRCQLVEQPLSDDESRSICLEQSPRMAN